MAALTAAAWAACIEVGYERPSLPFLFLTRILFF